MFFLWMLFTFNYWDVFLEIILKLIIAFFFVEESKRSVTLEGLLMKKTNIKLGKKSKMLETKGVFE